MPLLSSLVVDNLFLSCLWCGRGVGDGQNDCGLRVELKDDVLVGIVVHHAGGGGGRLIIALAHVHWGSRQHPLAEGCVVAVTEDWHLLLSEGKKRPGKAGLIFEHFFEWFFGTLHTSAKNWLHLTQNCVGPEPGVTKINPGAGVVVKDNLTENK